MKILKHPSPQKQLLAFLLTTPLITKFVLIFFLFISTIFASLQVISIYSLLKNIFLTLIALSDFRRQQQQGSIGFAFSLLFKLFTIFIALFVSVGVDISTVMLICLIWTAATDSYQRKNKYFLVRVLQMKNWAYCVVLALVFMAMECGKEGKMQCLKERSIILGVSIGVGIISGLAKINQRIGKMSLKFESKQCQTYGFVKNILKKQRESNINKTKIDKSISYDL